MFYGFALLRYDYFVFEFPKYGGIRCEKNRSKLHISRSFVAIFVRKKEMKHIFSLISFLLLASIPVSGQVFASRASKVALNGVPAVCDSVSRKMYFSLSEELFSKVSGGGCNVSFVSEESGDSLWLNGSLLSDSVRLDNLADGSNVLWHRGAGGAGRTEWSLCFTYLPIVCMEGDAERMEILFKNSKTRDQKVPCYVTMIDPYGRTDSTMVVFHGTADMRYRGATASGFAKKSFNIELTDSVGEEYDSNIFGMRNDGDWVMDAMYVDHARMRNRVITDIWNSIDDLPWEKDNDYQANGTSGLFVEAFLNGSYHGLYCFTDKIDRKKLNLKKTKLDVESGGYVARGLLYKARIWTGATYMSSYEAAPTDTLYWEGWEQKFPDEADNLGYWQPLQELIDIVNVENEELFAERLQEICYIDNLINYAILVTIFHCGDNVMKNSYASVRNITKEKRILFTPWDLDSSFGRVHNGKSHIDDPRLWAFGYQCPGMCALFNRLLCQKYKPHHWFKKMFRDRWNELREGTLSDEKVRARLMQYADLFTSSGAWARESERWTTLDEDEKGKDIHVPLGSIYDEVDYMMEFYAKNSEKFEDYIKDWPVSPTAIDDVEVDVADVVVDGGTVAVSTGDGSTEISIFDAAGGCVHRSVGAEVSVNVGKGVYVLRIRNAKGCVVRKIAVQ